MQTTLIFNIVFFRTRKLNTYAGYVIGIADLLGEQPVAYFPGESRRALALVVNDPSHDAGGRHPRFAAANRPRTNCATLVVSAQYLTDTSVRHLNTKTVQPNLSVISSRHAVHVGRVGEWSTKSRRHVVRQLLKENSTVWRGS